MKREITDCLGRNTGASVARYVWRSKPTKDPLNGRPVRCLVAQDEKGRFWAGTRIGGAENARHEFWLEPCTTKQEAMQFSREQTREFLSGEAQIVSNTVTGKKPGEEIAKVMMDDGWSMQINAPGRLTPAERKVMALFDRLDKGRQAEPKVAAKKRGREGPSR